MGLIPIAYVSFFFFLAIFLPFTLHTSTKVLAHMNAITNVLDRLSSQWLPLKTHQDRLCYHTL